EAAFAAQVADASAEQEAAGARGRDDPARRRHPVLVGGGVDLADEAAPADRRDACIGIDGNAVQAAKVDYEPVVDAAEPGAVVAAAADRDVEALFAAEVHRGHDVVDVCTACDQRRALVDHGVVERANLVVVVVALTGDAAVELLGERVDVRDVKHLGHCPLSLRWLETTLLSGSRWFKTPYDGPGGAVRRHRRGSGAGRL